MVKVDVPRGSLARLLMGWWEFPLEGFFFNLSSPFFLLDRKVTQFWTHHFLSKNCSKASKAAGGMHNYLVIT
jgi:hypothetical protein